MESRATVLDEDGRHAFADVRDADRPAATLSGTSGYLRA